MLFLIVLALDAEARAEEPDLVTFALGAFDVRDDGTTAEARLEFRSGFELLIFRPLGGLMVNADGGGFLYGGILLDIPFGRHIVATLSVAPGAYLEGNSKDLGTFAYQVTERGRREYLEYVPRTIRFVRNTLLHDRRYDTPYAVLDRFILRYRT